MTISAIHVGVNAYPSGNALQLCVADANGFAKIFGGRLLLDKKANRAEVMGLVKETARSAGDYFFGSVSGHGSQRKDVNADEPDGLDETFVTCELDEIVDDDFAGMVSGRKRNNRGVFVFDSCFSGNMSRAFSAGRNLSDAPKQVVRYLPPSEVKAKRRRVVNRGPQAPLRNMVVMSACTDFEFAYEGKSYGVWTGALIETYSPDLTIGAWFKAAAKVVADGEFGKVQHPQISCSRAALKWRVPSM